MKGNFKTVAWAGGGEGVWLIRGLGGRRLGRTKRVICGNIGNGSAIRYPGYWKKYLRHSPVNAKLFRSSAVSFAYFLAKYSNRLSFAAFAQRRYFLSLESLHPFLVMYLHPVLLETSICFCRSDSWEFNENALRLIVSFVLCFRIWVLSTTCQNRRSSASCFVFRACCFQPLVHPTFRLVRKFSDFFEWMTRWS